MIDMLIAGVLGGLAGPHLGGMFARVSYLKAILYGAAVGAFFFICMLFTVWALKGGSILVSNIGSNGWSDALIATLSLPALFASMFFLLRLFGQKSTWEQAQLEFEHEGYRRTDSEDGRIVTFERGSNKFIARVPPGSKPKQIEWYSFGERKGQIYLARSGCNRQA